MRRARVGNSVAAAPHYAQSATARTSPSRWPRARKSKANPLGLVLTAIYPMVDDVKWDATAVDSILIQSDMT